jgi:hypothetical protein
MNNLEHIFVVFFVEKIKKMWKSESKPVLKPPNTLMAASSSSFSLLFRAPLLLFHPSSHTVLITRAFFPLLSPRSLLCSFSILFSALPRASLSFLVALSLFLSLLFLSV